MIILTLNDCCYKCTQPDLEIKDLDKHDKQIRLEAIDECIAKITNEHTHSCYNNDVYECVKLLEQLKEQKHE